MKPFFVSSSVESAMYMRGEIIENNPVNLSMCKSIAKNNYCWYPDNMGLPSIEFYGCDTKWVYDDKETRDRDFERISNNNLSSYEKQKLTIV